MIRHQECTRGATKGTCIPAGSLRCERLVKSSDASIIGGLASGGRLESFGSLRAEVFALIVFSCSNGTQSSTTHSDSCNSKEQTYLAIIKLQHEGVLITLCRNACNLGSHPSFSCIGVPDPPASSVSVAATSNIRPSSTKDDATYVPLLYKAIAAEKAGLN